MGQAKKQNLFSEASAPARKKYIEGVTVRYRAIVERVLTNKGKQSDAIKAKCYDCCAYEDIVLNVHGCKSYTCPLWPFRPS